MLDSITSDKGFVQTEKNQLTELLSNALIPLFQIYAVKVMCYPSPPRISNLSLLSPGRFAMFSTANHRCGNRNHN